MVPRCPSWLRPIVWSGDDTDSTIIQVAQHNAKYDEFCHGTDSTAVDTLPR